MNYRTVIGLEVHVQLKTKSKCFCSCSSEYGAEPNTNICPVCCGLPGALPVLNHEAVELAVKAARALNCTVKERSIFARKNYFYPDLPKGYQISQYELPLAVHGWVEFDSDGKGAKRVRITRAHLEEDAGKLLHFIGTTPVDGSLVDMNRCGIPLLEIVSEPDITSPSEAHEYLAALKEILQYAGVSDCDMEKGSLRCDANVSVSATDELGTRSEIKNMNSFRAVEKALAYEVKRQTSLLEDGKKVIQETRLWDETALKTYSMRTKEEAHDYRYFPEPDLVPLVIEKEWVARLDREMAELPGARRARLIAQFGLSEYDARVITQDRYGADYYEKAVACRPQEAVDLKQFAKSIANWVTVELAGYLKSAKLSIEKSPVPPENLARLVEFILEGKISGKMAKEVLAEMFGNATTADEVISKRGLKQISDEGTLNKIVESVLSNSQDIVEKYHNGNEKVFGFLVGQVMKQTHGQADPKQVNQLLHKKLSKTN
jgi:aspartyl-tRNA(Asn)/glutamyl-tRNA(Gln) amidotransferase subunit B